MMKSVFQIILVSMILIYPLYCQQCSDIDTHNIIGSSFECEGNFIVNQNEDLFFSSSWGNTNSVINGNFIVDNSSNIYIQNSYTLYVNENFYINTTTNLSISSNSNLVVEKDFILSDNDGIPIVFTFDISNNSYLTIQGDLIINNNTSLILNNENTYDKLNINGSIINNGGKLYISNDVYIETSYTQNDGYIIFDTDNLAYLHSSNDIIINNGTLSFTSSNNSSYKYIDHYEYMFLQSDSGNIYINENDVNMEFIIYDSNSGKETTITTLPPHLQLTYKLVVNDDGSVSVVAVIDRVDDIPGTDDTEVSPNNPYNNDETLAIEQLFNEFINNTKPIPPSLSNVLIAIDLLAGNNAPGETDRDTMLRFYDSLKPINNNTLMQHTKEISENINSEILNILKNPINNTWISANNTQSTLQNVGATEGYISDTYLLQAGFSLYTNNNYHLLGSINYSNGNIDGNNYLYKLKDISYGYSLAFSYSLLKNTYIDYVFTYQNIKYSGNRYLIDNTLSTSLDNHQYFAKNTIQFSYTYYSIIDINPYMQFSYNYISGDSYNESGDGMVSVDKFHTPIYTPLIGIELAYKYEHFPNINNINLNTKINLSMFKDFYESADTNYHFIGVEDTPLSVENVDYMNVYSMININTTLNVYNIYFKLAYGYKSNHNDYKNHNINWLISFML